MSLAYAKTIERRRGTLYPAGVSLLDPVLTLNGVSQSPLLLYYGGDAGASSWAQMGVAGGALAIAGAGAAPTLGVATCFASDLGVTFNGGAGAKYFQSAGTTVGQVTTEDLVWELVVKQTSAAKNCRLFQKSTAGLVGWTIYQDSGSNKVYGYCHDGTNTVLPLSPSAMVVGRYYHYFLYMDRSENSTNGCAIVMNGTAGTGVNPSALTSITNAGHLTIGAAEDGSSPADNTIVHCAMWAASGWLAGGAGGAAEALAVAQARYARLKGIGG